MKIKVEAGRKDNTPIARIDGMVCFFEGEQPEIGSEVEAMIVMPGKKGTTLRLRLVRHDDVLIYHDGFECSGSMCRTTALAHIQGKTGPRDYITLTPGRSGIYVADNVNCGFHGLPYFPCIPGKVYVRDGDINRGTVRIQGLDSVEDMDFWRRKHDQNVIAVQKEHDAHHQRFLDGIRRDREAAV